MSVAEQIHPDVIGFWQSQGHWDYLVRSLEIVDEAEQAYKSGKLSQADALARLTPSIVLALKKHVGIVESFCVEKISKAHPGIEFLPEGTSCVLADQSRQVSTNIPLGMNFHTAVWENNTGAVFSRYNPFNGENLQPAFENILSRKELNIVELFFGERQLDIALWFGKDHFRQIVANQTALALTAFTEMLGKNGLATPGKISLAMSGISEADPDQNGFNQSVFSAASIFRHKTGIGLDVNLSYLGQKVGWIYGGLGSERFSEPSPVPVIIRG